MHKYIVYIGSDYNRKENLTFARQKLTESFSSICSAPRLEAKPLFFRNPALSSNQMVLFFSDKDERVVRKMLKGIERRSGCRPEDKKEERVCLDIDMLLYDNKILKLEDWQGGYIQQSLSAFHPSLFIKQMKFLGIISARYVPTRFPAEPLTMLDGKTVIRRVYEQVADVLGDVYVATDDERIEAAVKAFRGKVVTTPIHHKSGMDRCYEACARIGGDFNVVVNIQGDEPFIQPSQLDAVKACFDDATTQIAALVKPFTADEPFAALENVDPPKVVVNKNWNTLYFGRSIIPYQRNTEKRDWLKGHTYYKHIGLYAYRTEVLKEITILPQPSLELAESSEQLRWLENGYKIKIGISEVETAGVDTPQDLERAEEFLKNRI